MNVNQLLNILNAVDNYEIVECRIRFKNGLTIEVESGQNQELIRKLKTKAEAL